MSLEKAVDFFLLMEALPDELRKEIDDLLSAGVRSGVIYQIVLKAAGGKRGLTVMAVEVYLGIKGEEQ